jgi:aminoglycoside phosphotransferase (APT) family kinase protein
MIIHEEAFGAGQVDDHPSNDGSDLKEKYQNTEWLKERLAAFLAEKLNSELLLAKFHRISNGFSWITWTFEMSLPGQSSKRDLVLRIGPHDGLLAPYDATREAIMLGIFANSAVPVPEVLFFSNDTSIFGAPFTVCERMRGTAFNPWTIAQDPKEAQSLQSILRQFVDTLAMIHATPWRGTPAAELAGKADVEAAALDQIQYWEDRYRKNQLECLPIIELAFSWLRSHAPVAPKVALLHGDYRIGNFLTENGTITAILDWEMSHFGDPHQDIAWALYPPFGMPRLMERSSFFEAYSRNSGLDISEKAIGYYSALNLLKVTIINLIGFGSFVRRSSDMRLASLGYMTSSHLAQLMRAIRAIS